MFIFNFLASYVVAVLLVSVIYMVCDWDISSFDTRVEKGIKHWSARKRIWDDRTNRKMSRSDIKMLRKPHMIVAFRQYAKSLHINDVTDIFLINQEQLCKAMYKEKNESIKAYFAYMVFKLSYYEQMKTSKYIDLLVEYSRSDSLYIRELSFKALCNLGNLESVENAMLNMSQMKRYHSDKLLTDALLNFTGDKESLASKLVADYDKLIECTKVALINFVSYENMHSFDNSFIGDYKREISKDIRCSIIRLLGKKECAENYDFLMKVISDKKADQHWEVTAVAITALSNYKRTDEMVNKIIKELSSANWYVRMNSAKALCKLGLNEEEQALILKGNDKFAKDAYSYACLQCVG